MAADGVSGRPQGGRGGARPRSPVTDPLPAWRRTVRYHLVRSALRVLLACYLRWRVHDLQRLPRTPYVLCFNHLGWLDPFILLVALPARPRLFFYGPREEDMAIGARNRLIGWTGTAVPFKPGKNDLLTSARRAAAVLAAGHVLAVAGEGRLSEEEGVVLPLNDGPAYFAVRARVPAVPVAINGTRWLRFGKRIRIRVGEPIETGGGRPDRAAVSAVTAALQSQLDGLVRGYADTARPGPFGRWLTDAFSERPWLAEPAPEGDRLTRS